MPALQAMTSLGLCLPLAVFSLWLLASFLCHKLAKMALELYIVDVTSFYAFVPPMLVTQLQTLCCYALINVTSMKGPLFHVTVMSHVLATLATNTSLALTFASSTMAVKMLEPATSAVLQALLLKSSMRAESLAGMVVVVVGAVLYVGSPALQNGDVSRAVVLALLSNLTLGVRNVAMKLSQTADSQRSRLRSKPVVGAGLASALALVYVTSFVEAAAPTAVYPRATYFLLLSFASSLCHVVYSYVSTNVVLRYMSVVSHALANIFKRVLVVLLLHVSGRRSASLWNWAGLALCTGGLLLYNRGKLTSSSSSSSSIYSFPSVTSEESRDVVREKEACSSSAAASSSIRRNLLCRLLLFLVLAFVLCVTPQSFWTTQLFRSSSLHEKENVAPPLPGLSKFQLDILGGGFESKVLRSRPQPKGKSEKDYAQNLRHGHVNWTDGKPLIADHIHFQPERKSVLQIQEFLARENLVATPFDTDSLSPYLTTGQQVTEEAKRIHTLLFRDLYRGKKYALLLQLAAHENKGDSALSVGEMVLLQRMGIELLFYVSTTGCTDRNYNTALEIARRYPKDQVVVMLHGGGNIFGYPTEDVCRAKAFKTFRDYQLIFFPQSIYMRATKAHFDFTQKLYCCNRNLTILLRDRLSLRIARRLFDNGTRLFLAPDMAFENGCVRRYAPPYYDVIWQKRTDTERPRYRESPASLFTANVTVYVWDWLKMPSIPSNNSLMKAVNVLQNGLGILQKGRVVVTDRLHGHILSVLLDIPHVLLDNGDRKLSSYHNTWTRGLRNCRLADNAEDAARLALELLEEYRDSLPPRLRAADINENGPQKLG